MDCYFKTACRVNLFPGWCSLCSCSVRWASMTVEQRAYSLSDAEQYRLNPPPPATKDQTKAEGKTKVPTPPGTGSLKGLLGGKDGMFLPTKEQLIAQRKLLKTVSSDNLTRDNPR